MQNNTDITLFNKYTDAGTRSEVFKTARIKAVTWENRKAANVIASGNLQADAATIFIPMVRGRDYLKPKAWQSLTNKGVKWTLQPGDLVVKGTVDEDIDATFTAKDLQAKYDDVMVIKSVDTMDNGPLQLKHWKVSAQ